MFGDADTDPHPQAGRDALPRVGRHRLANSFADVRPRAKRRTPHHDDELVAAVSGDDVAVATFALQDQADRLQHLVADDVRERVVDVLETVEVDEEQAGGHGRRRRELFECGVEPAPVSDPGQRVLGGGMADPFVFFGELQHLHAHHDGFESALALFPQRVRQQDGGVPGERDAGMVASVDSFDLGRLEHDRDLPLMRERGVADAGGVPQVLARFAGTAQVRARAGETEP